MRHSFILTLGMLATVLFGTVHAESVDKTIRLPLQKRQRKSVASPLQKRQQQQRQQRLFNANGDEYHVEVGVGTPPQTFNLTIDTGSMALWIPSSSCPANQCSPHHFNSTVSTTFNGTKEAVEIDYPTGSINATYAYESVTVADLTVTNQKVALATAAQYMYDPQWPYNADGILGLSFQGVWEVPFVFNLVNQNLISQPIFSIFLDSQAKADYSGEIIFGGVDASKFVGNISYFQTQKYPIQTADNKTVQEYLFWMLPGAAISTTTGYQTSFSTPQQWVLDTSSSLSYAPSELLKNLVANVTNNQFVYDAVDELYVINCSLANSKEQVAFHAAPSFDTPMGNAVKISTPLSELVIPVNGTDPTVASSCYFGIAPTEADAVGVENWTLGLPFLRSVYSVYDMANYRIGIASVKGLGTVNDGLATNASQPSNGSDDPSSSTRLSITNGPWVLSTLAVTIAALLHAF